MPTAISANDAEYLFIYCINNKIEKAGKANEFVSARDLQRTCDCYVNKTKQNLSVWSCPEYKVISKYKIDRFFE